MVKTNVNIVSAPPLVKVEFIDINNYLPHQLKAMLTSGQVEKEFGLAKATLKYWRECTLDSGVLIGPLFFKEGNVNRYQRKIVIEYMNKRTFLGSETSETSKSEEFKKQS